MATVLGVFGCYLALGVLILLLDNVLPGVDKPKSHQERMNKALTTFGLLLVGAVITSIAVS